MKFQITVRSELQYLVTVAQTYSWTQDMRIFKCRFFHLNENISKKNFGAVLQIIKKVSKNEKEINKFYVKRITGHSNIKHSSKIWKQGLMLLLLLLDFVVLAVIIL